MNPTRPFAAGFFRACTRPRQHPAQYRRNSRMVWEMEAIMGSHSVEARFNAMSEAELREAFGRMRAYDDGDGESWNGVRGLRIEGHIFDDENAAREYVHGKTEKWGDALAVKVRALVKPDDAVERMREAEAARMTATMALADLIRAVNAEFGAGGALFQSVLASAEQSAAKHLACVVCGSKIARPFVKEPICPVCKKTGLGLTKAQRRALEKKQAEIKAAEDKRDTAYRKVCDYARGTPHPTETYWFVGGWAAG